MILTWDDPRTFEALAAYTFEGILRGVAPSLLSPPQLASEPVCALTFRPIPKGELSWR